MTQKSQNNTCQSRFTNASNSRTEKLKLNLIFEGDSHELPTKLHIEIKDCKGRVVFR